MKLKFKGTPGFEEYHGSSGNWYDGDEREVAEETAKKLLSSFPRNFSKVKVGAKAASARRDKAARSKYDK